MSKKKTQHEAEIIDSNKDLDQHVFEIRKLGQRLVGDVVEIGRRLSECKKIVGRGWLSWLDRELGLSDEAAYRFIRVAELANQTPQVVELNLPVSVLYLISAPNTPKSAREEVIERAKAGEQVSVAETQRVIRNAKGGRPATKRQAKQTKRRSCIAARSLRSRRPSPIRS